MSIEERAAAAAELKATGKCNCTQSVVKVFEDKLPIDDETLMKLTAGYAAGMGCMESTCGALIGAVMVAGKRHAPYFQRACTEFRAQMRCYHLQGPERH